MASILIAGDFCPWGRVAAKIAQNDHAGILSQVADPVYRADYAAVNLECPVTENAPRKGIAKMGPVLSCRPQALELLQNSGFSLVTLANNHFYDCGDSGVQTTLATCSNARLDTVGGGRTLSEAEAPLFRNIAGVEVAFINVCENEFSIAGNDHGGSAPLDPVKVFYRINEAKQKADFVIVIVHGGHEQYPLPSPRMQRTYRFFADAGAAAVVNHHQHCLSGYEIYNGTPIFYGLGNFCFDWPGTCGRAWHEGFTVTLNLDRKRPVGLELHPYIQCREEATVRPMEENEHREFRTRIEALNQIIAHPERLEQAFAEMASSARPLWVFAPFTNRYLAALHVRKLFPSFVGRKKRMRILNMVRCEAHRDVLMEYLQTHIK